MESGHEVNFDSRTSCPRHINGRFRLIKKIYGGPYCDVYTAKNILAGREVVAKLRHLELGRALKHEYLIQKALSRSKGIPHVRWFGTDWGTEVLVMDRSGLSLQDLMSRNRSGAFTVETVAEIACQAICILEVIHSWDFIHHNIKPSHLLFDSGALSWEGTVYLIDFGLARAYRHHGTHRHIPYKKRVPFVGSETFASIRALRGRQQSRRDDLQSLAYVLIYLLSGFLPWQECGLTVEEVIQAKVNIFQSSLRDKVPTAFFTFLEYACLLAFKLRPDYEYVRNIFADFHAKTGSS
ncbi:kinase-like domain-containing protein [Pisolithus albus]|nr:kinase-like domain-containing protein [Pisolithus albus]